MTDQRPQEPPKDWMETWYETGEITWQKPLSPEANQRLLNLFDELIEEQQAASEDDGGEP